MRADALRNRARIIEAAEAVFAEYGQSASTEEVARRAGVAIGTVFRHFPTKDDLLREIVKELLRRLTAEAEALAGGGRPEAFFVFFSRMVEQAAGTKTIADLLASGGMQIPVAGPVQGLGPLVSALLHGAQQAGLVRSDVAAEEVLALLSGLCQAALLAGWDADLQRRTLSVVFAGLAAPAGG